MKKEANEILAFNFVIVQHEKVHSHHLKDIKAKAESRKQKAKSKKRNSHD
jgi:uncharacterized membrane protein